MAVRRPSLQRLEEIATGFGFHFSPEELKTYDGLLQGQFDVYDMLDDMPDYLPAVAHKRTPSYYRPEAAENGLNAWYMKSVVKGAATGKLAGKTVALKDNVCLAGVPMMGGASTMVDRTTGEGFVPDIDAEIVNRLLDAGATIVGKSVCEYFCFSGSSHTAATGAVQNPHRRGYSAGGSSSGSGALVAAGEVDMAIGGDDGGSIRMPSSFCGVYGMKPTHGLVPCTGVMAMEATIDHLGPMSATVADNALMLEVIAGPDGLDPRQNAGRGAKPYGELMKSGVKGLKIGIVTEGFAWPDSHPLVSAKVRDAAKVFEGLGAEVTEVSISMHALGYVIWIPIGVEGAIDQTMKNNGHGFNWKGLYLSDLIKWQSQWRDRADELSEPLKLCMLLGEYFIQEYDGRFYGKAQNLGRKLAKAYDDVLGDYDLLLMPTTPMTATPLPGADASIEEIVHRAFQPLWNTCPFDVTGHPAMNVPCGMVDGLPVGMQLVGKSFEEETIYRAAYAFEQAGDWKTL